MLPPSIMAFEREGTAMVNYTPRELMVVCAARQIRDHEHVFVGMRLPLLAFALAKRTHAPDAIGLFECGIMRDTPSPELLYTMSDPPNVSGASWATSMVNLLGLMAAGEVQLGFIGGAEIDHYGNLNTSVIGEWQHSGARPKVRLPGSGGGADIASLSQRLAIIMPHERHRLRERVDFVTSPGYGYPDEHGSAGLNWRRRMGLTGGGPAVLITTLAVFRFDAETGEALLQSYHPGTTIEQVKQETGWPLQLAPDCAETLMPSPSELRVIRECDPQGVWTS
jgi:glutaconate CoA-transferase, subunit B